MLVSFSPFSHDAIVVSKVIAVNAAANVWFLVMESFMNMKVNALYTIAKHDKRC